MAGKSLVQPLSAEPEIRRIVIVNHGETVEKVFSPLWMKFYDDDGNLKCSRAFSMANYVTFEDGNLPISLMDRAEMMKMYERDPPLTEIGKLGALEVGFALGAAGVTASKLGGVVYCNPMTASIESAHYVCKGLALAAANGLQPQNDDVKLRIENGLIMQLGHDSRLNARNLPKWLTPAEIDAGLGRQVDASYKSFIAELNTESVEECYNRMKRTTEKIIQSVQPKKENTILIVGHAATMEGCTRWMYNGPLRRQRDFDNLCRQIPFCASIRMSEKTPNTWTMTEPLVPGLTHSANDAYRWEAFGDPNEMRKVLKK